MKPGREKLILSAIGQAQSLIDDQPMVARVVIHTGYCLLAVNADVWKEGLTEPYQEYALSIKDEAAPDDLNPFSCGGYVRRRKQVGRIQFEVSNHGVALMCRVPPVGDYELPGRDYAVQGRWFRRSLPKDLSGIAAAVVEFCRELVLFGQLYCDIKAEFGAVA